jgi:hypothetical protein
LQRTSTRFEGSFCKEIKSKVLVAPSSTTAPTPVTASTSALASTPSTAVTATAAAFTRTRLVYDDVASHEILAVEGLDNAGRFFIVADFNESEATGLPGVAVRHQAHGRYCCTRLFDPVAYIFLRSLEW